MLHPLSLICCQQAYLTVTLAARPIVHQQHAYQLVGQSLLRLCTFAILQDLLGLLLSIALPHQNHRLELQVASGSSKVAVRIVAVELEFVT